MINMHNRFLRHSFISLIVTFAMVTPAIAQTTVNDFILQSMPDWAEVYGDSKRKDGGFFNIDKMMKTFQLTRLQAIEAQKTFRNLAITSGETDREKLFESAIQLVKADMYQRVNRKEIENAKFVIVFDLDDTLYDQGLKADNQCANVDYIYAGKPKKIVTVKNVEGIARKIKSLGGTMAIFSANSEDLTIQNLKNWKTESGADVYSLPEISAILTGKELVYQSKDAGYIVTSSSKDLRFFDEQLEKVIIIDDNPTRIFQHKNIRVVKKMDGDKLCQYPDLKKTYESIIEEVMAEIEESAAYMERNKVSFVNAYLPYSMTGKLAVDLLISAEGLTKADAIQKVRSQPSFVDSHF